MHLKEKRLDILKKAKSEQRCLVFQDECAVRLLPCIQSSYAEIGNPLEIKCDAKNKDYVSISGVLSPDGFSYFEVRIKEGFKQKGLTRFLANALKACRRNLLIVWDNASSHKSETVKEYLRNQCPKKPAIWLENLPPYSPELNPIEQVWAYVKRTLANQPFSDLFKLKEAVLDTLTKLARNKEMIENFFRHEELKCYHFFD